MNMINYLKFSELAYIALAIFSIYSAITRWETDRNKAVIFLIFSVLLVILYYFKRRFRIRYEERRKNDQNKKDQ